MIHDDSDESVCLLPVLFKCHCCAFDAVVYTRSTAAIVTGSGPSGVTIKHHVVDTDHILDQPSTRQLLVVSLLAQVTSKRVVSYVCGVLHASVNTTDSKEVEEGGSRDGNGGGKVTVACIAMDWLVNGNDGDVQVYIKYADDGVVPAVTLVTCTSQIDDEEEDKVDEEEETATHMIPITAMVMAITMRQQQLRRLSWLPLLDIGGRAGKNTQKDRVMRTCNTG